MKPVTELQDAELRSELASFGCKIGPIAGTTRGFYEKKLENFRSGGGSSVKQSKGSVKRTPSKTNAPPVLAPTPLSAKKKSKRSLSQSSVSTESSDNELDLTIGDSSSPTARGSRSATSVVNASKNKAEGQVYPGLSSHSPPRPIAKRTPTPPRSSVAKRTPLRESGENSLSMRDYSKSNFFGTPDQDYDEDDHMESSRIISPSSRFDPFRRSSGVSKQPLHVNDDDSPLDKVKNFGAKAWGFFSRPVDSSTPCNDVEYKTIPKSLYDTHTSKYSRYTQGSSSKYSPNKLSGAEALKKTTGSFDVSGVILYILVGFFALLVGAYYLSANPKSIEHGFSVVQATILGVFNFLYTFAILPVLMAAVVGGAVFLAWQFMKQREISKKEHGRKKVELIDRVTDSIRDAQNEGVAEPHLRDMIMPPTKRSQDDWKLWAEVVSFINNEDSRVPVAEGSPSSNVPVTALSRCIKLRGLDFSDRLNEKIELRRDLRNKLGDIDPVHMEFMNGQESVVYMMFKNLQDAKKAFVAFHSNWFNGCLLTSKYVPDNRYIERFPEAQRHLK
uniref:LEM domain-containing protein n=1 Tax=Ditylenchus dipsaci TaxID=166011 RepID=A0A915DVD3_9BILA